MTAFQQALNEPKENTTKQTYELWRQKISEHRECIDANKLANVRTDVKKKEQINSGRDEIDQNENQATNKHRTKKLRGSQNEVRKPNFRASIKHHRTNKTGK